MRDSVAFYKVGTEQTKRRFINRQTLRCRRLSGVGELSANTTQRRCVSTSESGGSEGTWESWQGFAQSVRDRSGGARGRGRRSQRSTFWWREKQNFWLAQRGAQAVRLAPGAYWCCVHGHPCGIAVKSQVGDVCRFVLDGLGRRSSMDAFSSSIDQLKYGGGCLWCSMLRYWVK